LPKWHEFLESLALTLFVFGLLVWFYAIAIQVTHPGWLAGPSSHIDYPPFNWRVDDVGIVAFAVAALGFFVWRLDGLRKA